MTTCDGCEFTPRGAKQCAMCKLADACLEDMGVFDAMLTRQYPHFAKPRKHNSISRKVNP